MNLYCQDESRFGLIPHRGRALTARGVKPICQWQQKFEALYLFGAFSPLHGDAFLLELPYCDSEMFQLYVNKFAQHRPSELKVVLLDNGSFHKAAQLVIPDNIILMFIPPYTPELNPAESMCAFFKRGFSGTCYQSLRQVSRFMEKTSQELKSDRVKSTCSVPYIANAITQCNL